MRKFLLLICLLCGLGMSAQAQFPNVSVQDVQMVSAASLGNCVDTSSYNGDTVTLTGVVVTHPDSSTLTSATRGQVWIRSGFGPFSGLNVIQFFDPNNNGLANVIPGDSVQITGEITEFGGHESEIIPLENNNITILGSGAAISTTSINVCDLNDANQENQVATGEQWEGSYVEIQNVTVVSVDPFSGGTRVSFVVQDANGCRVNISDRFIAQRMVNGNPAGTFVPPAVGSQYNYIRGIVSHSPNGCTGSGGRGYEIFPTQASDYDLNASLSCPTASNIVRSIVTPTSSQAETITADIEDTDGVMSATLFYAVGVSSTTYNQVPMTLSGGSVFNGTWSGDIPAQADGSFVKYYLSTSDSLMNACSFPDVPGSFDPLFYRVRDNGTTIFDVQFVPNTFAGGNSGYQDLEVTVEGVVTASAEANNLGFVFIQQENELAWAGIMCTDNPSLATLQIGQKVTVTGSVRETFGFTRLEDISSVAVNGTGTITALPLDPAVFTSYDFATNEAYEGMLVQLTNPQGFVSVVNNNPDAPGNFAEWRLGNDPFDPGTGTRVLTGRVTNSAYSSLNVSYVNDVQWASTDGIMNVTPIVVNQGDQFSTVDGVMAYTFGNFKILPRNDMDFSGGVSIVDGLDHSIVTYPNPVSERFNIDYTFSTTQVNPTASVVDLMGRTVKVVSLTEVSGSEAIDVNNLESGTYLLKISSENSGLIKTVKFTTAR